MRDVCVLATWYSQVSQFASVLESRGVVKGDRVLIYMPMIPEAIVAMLASARIGAIHSLVFGGFASKELATRINHAEVLHRARPYSYLMAGRINGLITSAIKLAIKLTIKLKS